MANRRAERTEMQNCIYLFQDLMQTKSFILFSAYYLNDGTICLAVIRVCKSEEFRTIFYPPVQNRSW